MVQWHPLRPGPGRGNGRRERRMAGEVPRVPSRGLTRTTPSRLPCSSSPTSCLRLAGRRCPPLLRLRPRWPPRHWPSARCGLHTAATLPPLRRARARVRARQPPLLQGRAAARWLRTSAPPTPRSPRARTAGFPGTNRNAQTQLTIRISDFASSSPRRCCVGLVGMRSTRAVERPEADVVVIGSGLGGLCCAGLLARYGQDVLVLESHDRPGGAAHSFDIKGFSFDSGPSLFSGFQSRGPQANPLAQVQFYVIVHSLLSFL